MSYIIGVFHGVSRYEFMNVHEAQEIIEAWRIGCNIYRLHSSLDYMTPAEFVSQCEVAGKDSSCSLATVGQGGYPLTMGGT